MTPLDAIQTPALLLDGAKVAANVARMEAALDGRGVRLRPHLKTAKNIDVARMMHAGPATVSTLEEAEYFAAHGITDLIYAVGLDPHKIARVAAIRARGIDLAVILDSVAQAKALGANGAGIPAYIEIDVDDHRGGVAPESATLLEVAAALGPALRGVLTHAGESYAASKPSELAAAAENERAGAVRAAERLRAAGHEVAEVSIGSTPTALSYPSLDGVTEVRAGVYVFFDLVMAGIGVCTPDDVAISVLATVIGHQRDKGWILTDAGWMAISADRGTAKQAVDQGLGLVCDMAGLPYPDLIVARASQEHGTLALRSGSGAILPDLPIGTRVRILPNHACATAAQHAGYHVLSDDGAGAVAYWPRMRGW